MDNVVNIKDDIYDEARKREYHESFIIGVWYDDEGNIISQILTSEERSVPSILGFLDIAGDAAKYGGEFE